MIIDLPFRVSTQQCNNGYYFSKAGIMCGEKSRAMPIFGFACSKLQNESEYLAKCECAEHFYGTFYAYTKTELLTPIEVRTFGSNEYFTHIKRQDLLIGAIRPNGYKFTATGLALGNAHYDAAIHATQEVIERHLTYLWWNFGFSNTQLITSNENSNVLSVIFLTNAYDGYLAVAAHVGVDGVFFGSAFKNEYDLAINHAIAEQTMLLTTIPKRENLPARYAKLTNKKYISYVRKKVKERLNKNSVIKIDEIPPIHFAQLYHFDDFLLFRAYSDNAHDISSKQYYSTSPFL